jgi:osmotically-inducible protein OsmY
VYTARLSMPSGPALNPVAVQSEVQGVLSRSSMITNGGGIQVNVEGGTVVLRGTVKDAEEASTAVGVARLTPGVKVVKNELKY